MSDALTPGPKAASIIERAKNIILKPGAEWDRIETETTDIKGIYVGYVAILAAIGPLASLIGGQVFGIGAFGFSYRPPIISSIVVAVVTYALALVSVFVMALIIDALAPTFGGAKNKLQAFKVAAYFPTASWIAAIFGIIPMLGLLSIVGLYSLYILYLGLPKLMKAPQDKALGYTAVTILVAIVVYFLIGLVTAPLMMMTGAGAAGMGGLGSMSGPGSLTVNNGHGSASINLGQLAAASAAASAQMRAANAANGSGNVDVKATPAIPGDQLAAMLPPAVAGFPRTDVSSSSGGMGGVQASNATGTYTQGDARITMKLTDLGGMGAMAGMAAAFGVNSNEQHGTSYEKVSTANGTMTSEKYDTASRNGSYSVVRGRFAVEAEGANVDINTLKSAVAAVSMDAMASKAPH